MIATVWGSRGSLATPGAATLAYGGNTSCIGLRLDDGSTLVLDAGTGIRELGLRLVNRPPRPINLLVTHLHIDHLAGLPFFAPLWDERAELHIWAPFPRVELAEAIARYMSPPLFPVSISDVPASVTFHDLPERTWRLGSADVSAEPVKHVGTTVGYRIEEAGQSLAYLPDHEPYAVGEPGAVEHRLSGYRLARHASILVHDAQYLETEYPARRGWGHSSVAHAVAFASTARARRLVLFHHDPLHSDDDLSALEARAADLWPGVRKPELAREGLRLEFSEVVREPRRPASIASVERLQEQLRMLVAERQTLREREADRAELESNRLELASRQRELSHALIRRHLRRAA
jgi:phosphoribosyl 1,2-cyclic phosphodiesterase